MRFAPDADRRCSSAPEPHRLHHAVPGARQRRADAVQHGGDAQHRLDASTVRREAAELAGPRGRPRGPRWPRSTRACSRPSRPRRSTTPTSPRPASAGRSSTPTRARSSPASRRRHRLRRPGARGLRGPGASPRAIATRRWATLPDEVRVAGGAARSQGAARPSSRARWTRRSATSAREEAGAAGAAMMAAVAIGAVPRHGGRGADLGRRRCSASAIRPTRRSPRTYDAPVPDLCADPAGDAADLAPTSPRTAAEHRRMTEIAIIGDHFMLPRHVRRGAAPSAPAGDADVRTHRAALARRADGATATPRPGLAGLKEYHGRPRRDRATSSAMPRSWSTIWRRSPAPCSTACRR